MCPQELTVISHTFSYQERLTVLQGPAVLSPEGWLSCSRSIWKTREEVNVQLAFSNFSAACPSSFKYSSPKTITFLISGHITRAHTLYLQVTAILIRVMASVSSQGSHWEKRDASRCHSSYGEFHCFSVNVLLYPGNQTMLLTQPHGATICFL